jgi:HSP20 family molecular chaperone IbpA
MQNCQSNSQACETPRTASLAPSVDIVSGQDEVLIFADLPGVEAASIEVQFERGVLELCAKAPARTENRRALREEFALGDWRRSFRLSDEFDGSKTSAEYHNGVLCLRIPKAESARAQRVTVRAGNG